MKKYTAAEERTINRAKEIIDQRFPHGEAVVTPVIAADFFVLRFHKLKREVFDVLWLNTAHQIVGLERVSWGTIDTCSIFPRQLVEAALAHNAAACIFAHNHPSGDPKPSKADRALTRQLVAALSLIDIEVLDHIVTGGSRHVSFYKHGML